MALPSSGAISFANINSELGAVAGTLRSLNDAAVRSLFGKASGAIAMSDGYGKSSATNLSIAAHVQNFNIHDAARAAGWNGISAIDVVVTVGAGVYVWSDSTATPGMTTGAGWPAGCTITINNYGYIIGKGGRGSDSLAGSGSGGAVVATAGGPAMSLTHPVTIMNAGYIAGGGGGGASYGPYEGYVAGCGGGGGGAGGGAGGGGSTNTTHQANGGAGGAIGTAGGNGGVSPSGRHGGHGGGGGGRILPGSGGGGGADSSYGGCGGGGGSGGGGGGGYWGTTYGPTPTSSGAGGSGGGVGGVGAAAGGGGWGAAGGGAGGTGSPGVGGKAIALNGNSVSWTTQGTVYGAVS